MKNELRVVVGVDIGGTKVAAGLVNAKGEILVQNRTPMVTTGAPSNGLAAVSVAIQGLSLTLPCRIRSRPSASAPRDR
jgi:predicted NBD/HSP70 family sugar kinase